MVEIDPMVLKKTIFKFENLVLLFLNYLPLEKSVPLYLNKRRWPSCNDLFVSSLVEIGSVVLEEKIELWKFY